MSDATRYVIEQIREDERQKAADRVMFATVGMFTTANLKQIVINAILNKGQE